ncbi:MAG: LamG domain-containing protein [Sedimentisphaerales bacterium]|nr:LamG domain-containing protein [Sedimentisphaerales bacterium]
MKRGHVKWFSVLVAILFLGNMVNAEISSVNNGDFEADGDGDCYVPTCSYWTAFGYTYGAGLGHEFCWEIPEDTGPGANDVYWLLVSEDSGGSDTSGGMYQDLGTTTATGFYVAQMIVQPHLNNVPIPEFLISFRNSSTNAELASADNADVAWIIPNALDATASSFPVLGEVGWQASAATPLRIQIESLRVYDDTRRLNFDDIQVVNELLGAHNPSPGRKAVDVSVSALLSWTLAEDPANPGVTNPDITGQDIYLGTDFQNMTKLNPTTLGPGVTSFDPTLNGNSIYYWRVDTHTTGGTITGTIWMFATEVILPVITDQPDMVSIAADQGYDAIFTIQATNPVAGDLDYQWFSSEDPNVDTPGDDIELTNGAKYSGVDTNELTVIDVETADNDTYFYCQVSNIQGSVLSDSAQLAAGSEQYRWTFDNHANEEGGSGFNGTMAFGAAVYETNAAVGTHALRCDGNDMMVMGDVPLTDNGHFSVSLWTKIYNPERSWAALCGKGITDWLDGDFWFGNEGDQYTMRWGIHNPDTTSEEALDAYWGDWMWQGTPGNPRWIHIVCTFDTQKARIYFDGKLAKSDPGVRNYPLRQNGNQFYVGQTPWHAGTTGTYGLDALIDDIRLYNYALSAADVMKVYANVTGIVPCDNPPAGDTNGDCNVDLDDFANVAASWLDCNAPTTALCSY